MIWSPSRRMIFIHVPKTGGTSVEAAYEPHLQFGDVILAARQRGLDTVYEKRLQVSKHSPAIKIARLLGMQRFLQAYSFAVVRDPIQRMESYYKWIHSYEHIGPHERRLRQLPDFESFVDVAQGGFSTQTSFVNHPHTGEQLVTHLFPFSRLAEGWAQVCARLGIEAPLPHVNASKPVEVEVSEAGRRAVREIYAADFQLVEAAEAEFAALVPATPTAKADQAAE